MIAGPAEGIIASFQSLPFLGSRGKQFPNMVPSGPILGFIRFRNLGGKLGSQVETDASVSQGKAVGIT